jgi:hypothetical protein
MERWVMISFFLLLSLNLIAQDKVEIDEITSEQLLDILSKDYQRTGEEPPLLTIQLKGRGMAARIPQKRYLGDNWVVVRADIALQYRLLDQGLASRLGFLRSDSKISREFETDEKANQHWRRNSPMKVYLHWYGNMEKAVSLLHTLSIPLLEANSESGIIIIHANQSDIKRLADFNQVMYLSPVLEERTPLASTAVTMNRVNLVNASEPVGLGLTGEGIGVGVWDFGAPGPHKDISIPLVAVENEFFNITGTQHTTLVTGAIAGRGVLRPEIKGMAPDAKVYVHNFFGNIIEEIKALKAGKNVHVTNHSYNVGSSFRCFTSYQYSTASVLMDELARQEPRLVNVFAAGNSATACAYDFGTIVPGFQYGKNIILVGNLQNNETTYPGSAKGPTSDGRLKPDIMSKGASSFTPTTGIILPSPVDGYTNAYGTSFSSPQIAAIIGLMQQDQQRQGKSFPLNTTIRALLCNTAKDLGNPGPDYEFGFGRVDAYKAVLSLRNEQYFEGTVTQDEVREFTIPVKENVAQLKVFLTWNDVPAQLPAVKVQVNDLDLEVEDESGLSMPLVLDPLNPSRVAAPGRDSLNNVEQVIINKPTPGVYTIRVRGYDIPFGPQAFSVAWQEESSGIHLTYPLGGETLLTNFATFIRWDAFVEDTLLKAEYSLNGGETWVAIGEVHPFQGFMPWTTPNAFSNNALVRLLMNDQVVAISPPFAILGRPTINQPRLCNDHIRFGWTTVAGAESYIVSRLIGQNWVDIAEVTAPPFVFRNAEMGREYIFAVRTKRQGVESQRSIAVLYTPRPGICDFTQKDVGVSNISPKGGRLGSALAMTDAETLKITVRNYCNSAVSNIRLFYQVDNGTVYDTLIATSLSANAALTFTSPQTFNFSLPGAYIVRAWTTSPDDLFPENDTLDMVVRQADKIFQGLPYYQSFEVTREIVYTDSVFGIPEFAEWDYLSANNGRLTCVDAGQILATDGSKAVTLDNYADSASANNQLILNIDLANQRDSLVYMDFTYRNRGELTGNDIVWIRGNPSLPWVSAYNLFNNALPFGLVKSVKNINLSKILADNGQQFSSHTQIRWSVEATRAAVSMIANGGYTIDDVRIYNPSIDVELSSLILPDVICIQPDSLPAFAQVAIQIKNNFPTQIPAGGIQATYIVNETQSVSEVVNVPIQGFGSVTYTFSSRIRFDSLDVKNVRAYISLATDFLRVNDTIRDKQITSVSQLPSLPYETDFNQSNQAVFVSSGTSKVWQRGLPEKPFLYNTADDGQAWVTELSGFYPPNATAYLYVGCITFNQITDSSQIAFNLLYNLEPQADYLWLEYTGDGIVWDRLGVGFEGFNWYNNQIGSPKWDGDRTTWQVASYNINPNNLKSGFTRIIPRFVFSSDEFLQLEGAGIANFRIIKRTEATTARDSAWIRGVSNGSGKVALKNGSQVVAYLDDKGQNLGDVELFIINSNDYTPRYLDKYLLPRRFVFKCQNEMAQPVELTLFLKNDEYLTYLQNDKTVRRMGEIGIITYAGLNTDHRLDNNLFKKGYSFILPEKVSFWPYNDGYEIRFALDKKEAEIYLSSNQSNFDAWPFAAVSDLNLSKDPESANVWVDWTTINETLTQSFTVEVSYDNENFSPIGTVPAINNGRETNQYRFVDSFSVKNGTNYYRLLVSGDSSSFYTLIDSITVIKTGVREIPITMFSISYLGNGKIGLQFKGDDMADCKFSLWDITGRQLSMLRQPLLSGSNQLFFDRLNMSASGTYVLMIHTGKQDYSATFVKSD